MSKWSPGEWTRFKSNWPLIRDLILFVAGLAGVLHETLVSHTERTFLLMLYASMMGLPALIRGNPKG